MRTMLVVAGIATIAIFGGGLVTAPVAAADSPELVDGRDGVCRPTAIHSVFCDQPRNADGSWMRCVRRNPTVLPGAYEPAVTNCYTLRTGDPVPKGTAPDYIGAN
jgi:hypothetical protein